MNVSSIANFRKALDRDQVPCTLYRSGKPDAIAKEDIETFKQLGIRSIIDMRNPTEYKRERGEKLLDREFPMIEMNTKSTDLRGRLIKNEEIPDGYEPLDELVKSNDVSVTETRHYFVPMFNDDYYNATVTRLPWHIRVLLLFWSAVDRIFGTMNFLKYFFKYYHNSVDLSVQYENFIEDNHTPFLTVLKLLTRPASLPALICCRVGKHRTGLICAVIQGCLGFSKEDIIQQYHQSDNSLGSVVSSVNVAYGINKEMNYAGSDTMRRLLEHIQNEYGSIPRYLESIGFEQKDQEALKRNLLKTT